MLKEVLNIYLLLSPVVSLLKLVVELGIVDADSVWAVIETAGIVHSVLLARVVVGGESRMVDEALGGHVHLVLRGGQHDGREVVVVVWVQQVAVHVLYDYCFGNRYLVHRRTARTN